MKKKDSSFLKKIQTQTQNLCSFIKNETQEGVTKKFLISTLIPVYEEKSEKMKSTWNISLKKLGIASQEELHALEKKIEKLEKKLGPAKSMSFKKTNDKVTSPSPNPANYESI